MHWKYVFHVSNVLGKNGKGGRLKMILVIKIHFLTFKFYMVKIIIWHFLNLFQNWLKSHHNTFFKNYQKIFFFLKIQKKIMVDFWESLQKIHLYHVNFCEMKNKKFKNISNFTITFIWWNLRNKHLHQDLFG